jgi:hypothetical protein
MIRKVHVFQCGSADLYGVTQGQTGANLPIDECKEGWRFLKTVEMDEGLPPRGMAVAWQERDAAVRAAIAEHGYFLGEAAARRWKSDKNGRLAVAADQAQACDLAHSKMPQSNLL